MRFGGLSEIRAYWEALRQPDQPLPARAAFDPRGIERALPQAFLAARGADRAMQMRLAGQEVCAVAGLPGLRGLSPELLMQAGDRAALARLFDEVLDGPALAEIDLAHTPPAGGDTLPARMVLLPLADRTGRAGVVLGGLAMPRRPALPGPALLTLRAVRMTRLEPGAEGAVADKAPAPQPQGLAEAPAIYAAQALAGPGRRHLRVVK